MNYKMVVQKKDEDDADGELSSIKSAKEVGNKIVEVGLCNIMAPKTPHGLDIITEIVFGVINDTAASSDGAAVVASTKNFTYRGTDARTAASAFSHAVVAIAKSPSKTGAVAVQWKRNGSYLLLQYGSIVKDRQCVFVLDITVSDSFIKIDSVEQMIRCR